MFGVFLRGVSIVLAMVILSVVFSGCALFSAGGGRYERRVGHLDLYNFWQHLSVTIEGSRLHFFGHDRESVFTNVIITYMVFDDADKPFSSVVVLSRDGRGQTQMCLQIFPTILSINGTVQYRV